MTLQLVSVTRNFGSSRGVQDVSLALTAGQIVSVLGANGAGKSTLLRLVAGWLPVESGQIAIQGRTLRPRSAAVRRRAMMLDDSEPQSGFVTDMLGQAVDDYQVDRPGIEDEVADWFREFGLLHAFRKSNDLSKGQRFKVALTALFVVRPFLWLLDEPFAAGLDANGMEILEREVRKHRDGGGLVLFTSQWPDHANRIADRVIVLHEGRLVCDEPLAGFASPVDLTSVSADLRSVLVGLGRE